MSKPLNGAAFQRYNLISERPRNGSPRTRAIKTRSRAGFVFGAARWLRCPTGRRPTGTPAFVQTKFAAEDIP